MPLSSGPLILVLLLVKYSLDDNFGHGIFRWTNLDVKWSTDTLPCKVTVLIIIICRVALKTKQKNMGDVELTVSQKQTVYKLTNNDCNPYIVCSEPEQYIERCTLCRDCSHIIVNFQTVVYYYMIE